MDLLQNPFYILGATLRDNKRRIIELAEEKSLYFDSVLITKAQADLTNPHKRLAAELAWLPGASPRLVAGLLDKLTDDKDLEQNQLNDLSPLAKVNFFVSQISHKKNDDTPSWTFDLSSEILAIAEAFESVDMQKLVDLLNTDRMTAGFSVINDELLVMEGLRERRRYICHAIKEALSNVISEDVLEIMKLVVRSSTDFGNKHGFIVIDDLVARYEIESQEFFEKEAENIKLLISTIRESFDKGLPTSFIVHLISKLMALIKNWHKIAEPIQLNTKSKGSEHRKSCDIALSIRTLSIDMYNNYGQLELATSLTETIRTFFADVATIADRVNEDIKTIGDLTEEAREREAEFAEDITYETSVGIFFKEPLKISPKGIEWKDTIWPLDEITEIRWGGVTQTANVISHTIYGVYFGSGINFASIQLKKRQYGEFVECLWKAVGVNILMNFLKGLQSGKQYVFGTTEINDEGITLKKNNFLSTEEKYFSWAEVVIWNRPGYFCIGRKEEEFNAAFSYLDDDNTHVLEAAIRAFWKNGGRKLSSLLER